MIEQNKQQPAAAQEAGTVEIIGRTYLVRDVTAALAKAGYAAPVTAAPEASYFEYLDRYNHSLRRAIHAMMAKLVFLLDEDQFADIDAIALAAGVTPAAPGIDLAEVPRYVLSHTDDVSEMRESERGAWVRLRDVEDVLAAASPKATTFRNYGDSEAQFIADETHLNCPACGGSGHVDASPKGGSDARDAALNTLAQMFHNSEEMEGPDGMVVSIDLSLWHEALEAYEVLIDGYDEVTLATSAQAQASDAEVQPLCDLCRKRPEAHSDAEGIGFCEVCWGEWVEANSHGAGVDRG